MKVIEVLNQTMQCLKEHSVDNPRLDAELLLGKSMGLSREDLYIHLHSRVKKAEREALGDLIRRRISGEPLQYISGHQEFWSVDFKVDPHVLIPRPETELLVEETLSILSARPFTTAPLVLELGTGSGAIAISLAREVKDIFVVATDISTEALLLARENALRADVLRKIAFLNGDLFGPIRNLGDKGPFDVILSNPPYIARPEIGRLPREVKSEPVIALDGGEDGLSFYRRIVSRAPSYLQRGGWLLLEIGQGQGFEVSHLIGEGGAFLEPQLLPDLAGIDRIVKAQKR